MTTDSLAETQARADVRAKRPSSPTIVGALLETIDRLERERTLREDDQ